MKVLVAQLSPTLFNSLDCSPPGSVGFPRQEFWGGLPFPSPGNLLNPGIKPRSPALQAASLPLTPRDSLLNTLQSGFHHHCSTKIVLVNIFSCLHITNLNRQFLVLSLLTISATFDQLDKMLAFFPCPLSSSLPKYYDPLLIFPP